MEQMLLGLLFSMLAVISSSSSLMDQATLFKSMLAREDLKLLLDAEWAIQYDNITLQEDEGSMESDLIRDRLPGQPSDIGFKHYAGYVTVNKLKGRSLFYYFVESTLPDPVSKPVILWLNGGPGCSSIGIGAFAEHGPFGVLSDRTNLYLRHYSWNKVANILYLESPAGVGFSYSNTTADYDTTGDSRTAKDSYVFLVNWFKRFSQFKNSDFYIAGESYAGFYIPQLAHLIIHKNLNAHPSSKIQLKGVMIGNGMMDFTNTKRGIYEYHWSHTLISDNTYHGLIKNCLDFKFDCAKFEKQATEETGNINMDDLYSDKCDLNAPTESKRDGAIDNCEKLYVNSYMNLPEVQTILHVKKTPSPYPWALCSLDINRKWKDHPLSTLFLYKNLISSNIRILVYSGDVDGVIPFMSTKISLKAMNITEKSPWRQWLDERNKVAGYRVHYEGLTFMTVLGAGHEVPRLKPHLAFLLIKLFLEGL